MALAVSVGCGASAVLFGEENVFGLLCKGEDRIAEVSRIYCDEAEVAGGEDCEVLSFLHVVPRAVRLSLWARLSDRPTVREFVCQLMVMGLVDKVDDSVRFYPTLCGELVVARGAGGFGLDYAGLQQRLVSTDFAMRRFRLPTLVDSLPDGYCYLPYTVGGPKPVLAAIFEAYPNYSVVSPFLKVSARADIVGDIAHVSETGASVLEEVGRPGLLLGGPVCRNQDDTRGVAVCQACQASYPLQGVEAVGRALGSDDGDLPTFMATLRTPGATDVDIACMVEASCGADEVEPGGRGGIDRLGLLAVRDAMITTPQARWVVWLDTGESLVAGDFVFQPRTFGGGLLAGFGPCDFQYSGRRSALACRGFSPGAWLKFQHTLRLGVGGSVRDKIRDAALVGCAWLLMPGSGSRGLSHLWQLGNHPTDLLPGRAVQTGGLTGDLMYWLSPGSKRALDVGRTPVLVDYEGVCRFGDFFQVGTRGSVVLWSPYKSQTDFLVGGDSRAKVYMRPYVERRMASGHGSAFKLPRRRRKTKWALD